MKWNPIVSLPVDVAFQFPARGRQLEGHGGRSRSQAVHRGAVEPCSQMVSLEAAIAIAERLLVYWGAG